MFSKFALTDLSGTLIVPIIGLSGLAALALWHSREPSVLVLTAMLGGLVVIPLLASIYFPMILARYFLVGLAPLYLIIALVVVDRWQAGGDPKPMVAVLGVAAILATVMAPSALRRDWENRALIWHTEPAVRACLTRACADEPVRVWHWRPWASGIPTPEMTRGVYDLVFRDYKVRAEPHKDAPPRDVSALQCPVVAWAESTHFNPIGISDGKLLDQLRLVNSKGVPLAVHRHISGYALFRADLPCAK